MTKPPASAAPETPPPTEAADPFEGLVRGRIVHFWPRDYEARNARDAGPWPAMVTNVEDDKGTCTLNVNMPKVAPVGEDPVCRMTAVPFRGEDGSGTVREAAGGWTWIKQ